MQQRLRPEPLYPQILAQLQQPAAAASKITNMLLEMGNLGERRYPQIAWWRQVAASKMASKITGMLLEMGNAELLLLLKQPASLNEKIAEATHGLVKSGQLEFINGQLEFVNGMRGADADTPAAATAGAGGAGGGQGSEQTDSGGGADGDVRGI